MPIVVDHLDVATVLYALLSLTVLRMLPVALALVGTGLDRRTVLFVGWFGPRGLASVVFALLAIEELGESPVVAEAIAAVCLTVLLSVVLHGVSAGPLGRRYVRLRVSRGRRGRTPAPERRTLVPDRWREDACVTTTSTQHKNMVWVPGGDFLMGSEDFYPEERPVHTAHVGGFWMDAHPVTVAEFRRFVKATGHVTVAETAPEAVDFPDATADQLVPGSLVFTPPGQRVSLDDFRAWWAWVPGAQWRHPEGPGSTLNGRELHPVTHVAYADALAYASWAGKELPTEPEWEFAARGGLEGAVYAWGDEVTPRGRQMANTWQGDFPVHNDVLDGYERTSPVGAFPPNGYGLVDMTGNVWEWTCQDYTSSHAAAASDHGPAAVAGGCCAPRAPPTLTLRPHGVRRGARRLKVIKGGSHLCAPNYCLRYRPAARQSQTLDTSTSHLGFRCISRGEGGPAT